MQTKVTDLFYKLDSSTYNHSIRVMLIASEIEESLSFADHGLRDAALLHDIGKIYVSPVILDKVGKLSVLEREIVDLHPYIGYKILQEFGVDENICRIVLYHHGEHPITIQEVSKCRSDYVLKRASMLHTIDVFEALTSDRPYHRGVPAAEALKIMIKEKDHNPEVIKYIANGISGNSSIDSAIHRCYRQDNSNSVMYALNHIQKKAI